MRKNIKNAIRFSLFIFRFSFFFGLQEDLNEVSSVWENHRIRPVHNLQTPHGRLSIMHAVPHLYGVKNHLHHVDLNKMEPCLENCVQIVLCDEDVFDICVDLISAHNLEVTDGTVSNCRSIHKTSDNWSAVRWSIKWKGVTVSYRD